VVCVKIALGLATHNSRLGIRGSQSSAEEGRKWLRRSPGRKFLSITAQVRVEMFHIRRGVVSGCLKSDAGGRAKVDNEQTLKEKREEKRSVPWTTVET